MKKERSGPERHEAVSVADELNVPNILLKSSEQPFILMNRQQECHLRGQAAEECAAGGVEMNEKLSVSDIQWRLYIKSRCAPPPNRGNNFLELLSVCRGIPGTLILRLEFKI